VTTAPGTHKGPLTDLFPRLLSREEAAALRLSTEQVRSFEANGYVAGVRVLDGAALDAVREAVERIRRGDNPHLPLLYEVEEDYFRDPERNTFHCLGGWRVEAALHDLVFHPAATVPAAQLLALERLRQRVAIAHAPHCNARLVLPFASTSQERAACVAEADQPSVAECLDARARPRRMEMEFVPR